MGLEDAYSRQKNVISIILTTKIFVMKYFLVGLLFLSLNSITSAAGIEFFDGTWEEALEKASIEEKVIFVDAFTTWCGPCKRMAKNVFTDQTVGDFFNEKFVSMKIDMEKKGGIKFQQKYPVQAYTTLYFIDGKGKVVQKVKGAQTVDNFLNLGTAILSKVDYSAEYASLYEAGDRSPDLVHKYVKALIKSGKSSGKVANSYLKSQDDLNSKENLQFMFDALVEADSRIFTQVTDREKLIQPLVGKEVYLGKIKKACERTLKKSIEYGSVDLKEEAKTKMKSNHPSLSDEFDIKAEMDYSFATKNADDFSKAIKSFKKKYASKDPSKLYNISAQINSGFPEHAKLQIESLKLAKTASEMGGVPEYHLHYAEMLFKNNEKTMAIAEAKKALELSKGDRQKESMAIRVLKKYESA